MSVILRDRKCFLNEIPAKMLYVIILMFIWSAAIFAFFFFLWATCFFIWFNKNITEGKTTKTIIKTSITCQCHVLDNFDASLQYFLWRQFFFKCLITPFNRDLLLLLLNHVEIFRTLLFSCFFLSVFLWVKVTCCFLTGFNILKQ